MSSGWKRPTAAPRAKVRQLTAMDADENEAMPAAVPNPPLVTPRAKLIQIVRRAKSGGKAERLAARQNNDDCRSSFFGFRTRLAGARPWIGCGRHRLGRSPPACAFARTGSSNSG